MTATADIDPVENLTRPIVGIENRTAVEVFDIMCDRIARAMQTAMAGRVTVRPSPQIGEEAAKYCAERGERWAKTFRALRNYRMGNMVDEDGGSYPLVDLLTRPGDYINDGEFELISIVDEVFSALEPVAAQEGAGGDNFAVARLSEALKTVAEFCPDRHAREWVRGVALSALKDAGISND